MTREPIRPLRVRRGPTTGLWHAWAFWGTPNALLYATAATRLGLRFAIWRADHRWHKRQEAENVWWVTK